MGKSVCFFFGAGAECKSFGLLSGSDYTRETMCRKKTKLYDQLRAFYSKRLPTDYVESYRGDFLFTKGSHTFREITRRAAKECDDAGEVDESIEGYIKLVKEYNMIEDKQSREAEEIKAKMSTYEVDMYESIILDVDNSNDATSKTNGERHIGIKNHLSYYGAVEKDFSTIVDPKSAGIGRFWRLINYFWSAYFSILLPLCKKFQWYKEDDTAQNYQYVLEHLQDVTREIYESYDYADADSKDGNYYKKIAESFDDCVAMTTNYTPFIEHYFGRKRSIYLAGKLSEIEYPTELSVKDIRDFPLDDSSFFFPFLMTQASVKPIVAPIQIEAYARALSTLERADVVVIIGYSLCEEDNHVNAILRDFVTKEGKKIIYCHYCDENEIMDEAVERKRVLTSLKLTGKEDANIEVVCNHGNAEDLVKQLKSLLPGKELAHV